MEDSADQVRVTSLKELGRVVDVHTHLLDQGHWPTEWWRWVAEDWASKGPGRRAGDIEERIESGLIDPDGSRMLAEMDAAGVDVSVILPVDWGPDYTGTKPVSEIVEHALEISRRYPGRFAPFGGIDPRRPGSAELVSSWFEGGIRGLKLYPSCGWHPDFDDAAEIYAVCSHYRAPVLFHTGDPLPLLDRTNSSPGLLRDVAHSFPDMPIWLGHAGAPRWWAEAIGLASEFENVRLEMSVWIWSDSTESDKDRFVTLFAEALGVIGPGRVVFGSDNVSGSRVRERGFVSSVLAFYRELPSRLAERGVVFSAKDLALVLGGNALRDLGPEPIA